MKILVFQCLPPSPPAGCAWFNSWR